MAGEIAVTGVGLVTPGGVGAPATWRTVCDGRSTAERDEALAGLPVDISCPVPGFDGDALLGRRLARRLDRATQLGMVAAHEAMAMADLPAGSLDPARVGVLMGSGGSSLAGVAEAHRRLLAGRPETISPTALPRSLPSACAGEIALGLGATGPAFAVVAGCASPLLAVRIARDLLASGDLDVAVVGGAESLRHPLTVAGFAQLGTVSRRTGDPAAASRPFDADRDGLVVAEGAAVLVLERPGHARARRAPVLAWLAGCGAAGEAHHPTAPDPEGAGGRRAAEAALADAGWQPEDIGHVNAHGAATVANDAAEASWLAGALPHRPPVTAPKGALGHAGAGSGAIEAALTVLALRERLVPPTANLDRLDPAFDLDVVAKSPRPVAEELGALTVSAALGGQSAALLLRCA
ncbi:beta-ketoacyl-[acyl-carrier-protein] synthase family protein [Streptomyces sp. 8K308]|uniref:beta-ketoacyl-[acyl-carrier-protein] synthase family protein n=1 Tax=Streptomyces sp. 8K308 TaxID=2530388 RepID=UPI001045D8C1|nr:beta-ketoacyl-[acyl-carrier-protein] synthase family protein [Streptomyces sp. 8K308]TDC22124.1 beta-ketoacyl-[acyl-carrier-protein] synthase family protein [Streptomyces sp. 8K308]